LREGFGRGAVQDSAVSGGENAAVAGAGEDVVGGLIKHGAGVMGAEAAERNVGIFGGAKEKAGAVVDGIGENFGAADWDFVGLGDYFCGVAGFEFLPVGDQGACERDDAGDAEPFVETAAGNRGRFLSLQAFVICSFNGRLL
jgi:hypothetical protein